MPCPPHFWAAEAVSPNAPRRNSGFLLGVFTEVPSDGGYDMALGMSERGKDVDGVPRGQQCFNFWVDADQHHPTRWHITPVGCPSLWRPLYLLWFLEPKFPSRVEG